MLIYWYYYNTKILLPVSGRRLVYRFGPNAQGWRNGGVVVLDRRGSQAVSDYRNHNLAVTHPLLSQAGDNYLHCPEFCIGYDDDGKKEFDKDDEL
ncbi:hypothetical protein L596_003693 [Steinernema carpocapsae]|uniref:Uncharacterized protein n=1 Tax=Steinernema carpocapsae TaxID=34508 RepID=A0A4U8UUF7_STECR|nr:hypothetical protein L596_003693 [Steinernema carpocapsae]